MASRRSEVEQELIRNLFEQGTLSAVTQSVIGVVFVAILWSVSPAHRQGLLIWLALQWCAVALRVGHMRLFATRRPQGEATAIWAVQYTVMSLLFGLLWGATCFLFLDPAAPASLVVVVVFMVTMSTGAAIMLAAYLPAFLAFALTCMLSLVAALVWHGDDLSLIVALLAGISVPAIVASAVNVQRTLRSSLELSLENVALRRESDGKNTLLEATLRDLRQRETALEAARVDAVRANAAKTRFLAAASHDLRQPIQALWLLFGALSARIRDARASALLDQIEDSIRATDSILNSLLDVSKLDAGVVRPTFESISLERLLTRLNAEFQPIAHESGNDLRVRAVHAVIRSDPAMLERMLRNIIANALRYTKNGRVLVGARRRADRIRIETYDTGPGIPPEELENIFLEFHQLGNPERDRRQGLGLGLAIVKRMSQLLDQPVDVRSVVGHGSRFSLTVPVSLDAAAARAPAGTASLPGDELRGRRVLVLDDDVSVLLAIQELLESWGCEVTAVATAEDAATEVRAAGAGRSPELLIVDYRLRGQSSGLTAAAELVSSIGATVPTVILTGDTAPDRLHEAEKSGYLLLHKPVQPSKLRASLRQKLINTRVR